MDEYIEREATCKDCIHYDICIFHHKGNENKDCMHFKNKADVVEERHGRWEAVNWGGFDCCSVCSCSVERQQFKYHYCPNCGAKMDGKGEGE